MTRAIGRDQKRGSRKGNGPFAVAVVVKEDDGDSGYSRIRMGSVSRFHKGNINCALIECVNCVSIEGVNSALIEGFIVLLIVSYLNA